MISRREDAVRGALDADVVGCVQVEDAIGVDAVVCGVRDGLNKYGATINASDITITNTTVTEPIKKFSRFVSIPASQEICSCAA